MRHFRFFPLLLVTALLLTSCNIYQVLPRPDINVSLIDSSSAAPDYNRTQIRISPVVDEDTGAVEGFTIEPVRFLASARAGSMGANITDYSISYFYGDGTSIPTGSGQPLRGSLSLLVQPGLSCPGLAAGQECTVNTTGVQFAPGESSVSGSFYAIDSDIITTLWTGTKSRNEAYASITLNGLDDNGNAYSKELDPVTIIFVAE